MNHIQQQLFDEAVLGVLDANRTRFGMNADSISNGMSMFGFASPNRDTLLDRLDYLQRHSLVEEVSKQVNKANRAWRITDQGISHLDK